MWITERGAPTTVDVLQALAAGGNAKAAIDQFRHALNPVLEAYLAEKADQAGGEMPPLAERTLREFLTDFTLRGEAKRVRPLLLCCGYFALGGRALEPILRASLSIELLQTALLIHDDIIDRSRERRSGKTMHRLWEDYFGERDYRPRYDDDRSHFGGSMGILLGDLSCAIAYDALVGADFPKERKFDGVRAFTDVIRKVAFGELLEVDLGMKPLAEVSEDEILKVYELKTSCYTTEGPLHIGAALGGATPEHFQLLSDYALPLGVAFQLQDDVLGLFGRGEDTGKDEGADLIEGKRTLLLLKAWERSQNDAAKRDVLERVLQRPNEASGAVERVREIVVETGALRDNVALIERHLEEIERSLDGLEQALGPQASAAFRSIAGYIEQRGDYRSAVQSVA